MKICGCNCFHQLDDQSNNKDSVGRPIISPFQDLNSSFTNKISSYSTYYDHTIAITKEGKIFTIGDNSEGQISNFINKKKIDKFMHFKIDDDNNKYHFISAVCGKNYTLYLASEIKTSGKRELIYSHKKLKNAAFISLTKYRPVSLFGGSTNAAVVDEKGSFMFFPDNSSNLADNPEHVSLPNGERTVSIACCQKFIVVVSSSSSVYYSEINDKPTFVNLRKIESLQNQQIIDVSGTFDHCFALSKDGRVFAFGSNKEGQLGIGEHVHELNEFIEISTHLHSKIKAVYAGANHSLFLTEDGRILACGSNRFGQLLNDEPTKKIAWIPIETKIANNACFCVAGVGISVVFTENDPINSPNRRIMIDNSDEIDALSASTLNMENQKLKKEIKSLKRRKNDLYDDLEKANNEIKGLKKIIDELKNDKSRILNDISQDRNEIDNLNEEILFLNEQIKEEKSEHSKEIIRLKNKIYLLNETNSSLEEQMNELRNDKLNLSNENIRLKNEIDHLNGKNSSFEEQIDELKNDKSNLSKENILMENDINNLNEEIRNLKKKINDMTNDKKNLSKENNRIKDELADLNKAIKKLNKEKENLEEDNIRLISFKNENENLIKDKNALNENYNILKIRETKFQKEIYRLREENDKIYKKIKELESGSAARNVFWTIFNQKIIDNEMKIKSKINGGQSTVYIVKYAKKFALKVLKVPDKFNDSGSIDSRIEEEVFDQCQKFIQEYEILTKLNHKNIIRAYDYCYGDPSHPPSILLQYCPENLRTYISKMNNVQRICAIYEIACAMEAVHNANYIHRDIKPENILIDENGHVKVTDFGISKIIDDDEAATFTGDIGTLGFMAPEIYGEPDHYDNKVDVFSFGHVLYFILTKGQMPKRIQSIFGKKPPIPDQINELSKDLLNRCWSTNADERPSFSEILEIIKSNDFALIDGVESNIIEIKEFLSIDD